MSIVTTSAGKVVRDGRRKLCHGRVCVSMVSEIENGPRLGRQKADGT
jgi:hypothetical protein